MEREVFSIGALYRSAFRNQLFLAGLDFEEDRGLLDSQFRVTGDTASVDAARSWVTHILEREEARQKRKEFEFLWREGMKLRRAKRRAELINKLKFWKKGRG